jgi:hypothetical protein
VSHPKGPPPEQRIREAEGRHVGDRDMTPAVGKRGEAGRYRRAVEGAKVALAKTSWGDARWSYLYDKDTGYAAEPDDERVAEANRRARGGADFPEVQGPVIRPAVWTWEVPLYFWFGGIATGSAFVAMACDAAGDHESAAIARKVTLGAVGPAAPLLVMDLGRPERFLHMMRIFKLRSPMSMGAWCLSAFSGVAFFAVAADVLDRPRLARLLGVKTAVLGTYLGSYTGVLLASTAVPVWARSKHFLGPIFIATGTATGAAANRLVLVALGQPAGHPTRNALGTVETLAMGAELAMSSYNEHRLGRLAHSLEEGRPGKLFQAAKWMVRVGLALRFARGRGGPWVHNFASVLYLLAGLAFRFAWVGAGRTSALDHEAVARMHRTEQRT